MGLWPTAEPYWDGFVALDRGRTWAMGMMGAVPQPLAYSEIAAYARDHRFTGDDFDEFVDLIGQMDRTFLAVVAERLK